MTNNHYYYTAVEVAELIGVSKPTAYAIIRLLNTELTKQGYRVVQGKVSKRYFEEKYYISVAI